jgi:pimeloyl-ACP methyl ester carboxylesterase
MWFEVAASHYTKKQRVVLHYMTAGPEDGEVVVMLHGFPEFYYGWRNQVSPLVEAGYRVVIPDQRGYNLSDKPRGFWNYDLDQLAQDILDLVDELDVEHFYLAGHDWGAEVAWWLAIHSPERLKRMAVLNVPHPAVMYRNIRKNRVQRRRSWYIFVFQIPLLPELFLRMDAHKNAARLLDRSSLPGSFSEADLSAYRAAWSQPGAWTGMIHWYRAVFLRAVVRWSLRKKARIKLEQAAIEVPVLIIWGENDVALEASMAAESLAYCPKGRLEMVPDATHWVQHDASGRVSTWLVEFFGDAGISA